MIPYRPLTANAPEMRALIKALGLPDRTIAFNMRARRDDVVRITCQYIPEAGAATHIATYLVCVRETVVKDDTALGDASGRHVAVPR